MVTNQLKSRGFQACILAVLLTMTVAPAANATIQATDLSIKAIGLSVTAASNFAYVTFTTALTGHNCAPPVGSPSFFRVVFDHTSPKGRAIMSLLTAAQLAGKKVSVTGNNTCVLQVLEPGEAQTQTESINWLRIE